MTNSTTTSHTLITIDSIHNGPAHSGHGGVSGGRFAELIDADAASVRFQAPIPLDEPLWATSKNDTTLVSGASGPVASVHRLEDPLAVGQFGRLARAEVVRAEAAWLDCRAGDHIAPTCFACGHRRTDTAGLGLRPGPVETSSLFATSWSPTGRGDVPSWMVWAALDCPSGMPAVANVGLDEAVVTAQLSVEIRDRVHFGGDYQLLSRRVGGEDRKHHTEAALIDESGRSVAVASAMWVTVPLHIMQPDRGLIGAGA